MQGLIREDPEDVSLFLVTEQGLSKRKLGEVSAVYYMIVYYCSIYCFTTVQAIALLLFELSLYHCALYDTL
jgi:hypothetical protein